MEQSEKWKSLLCKTACMSFTQAACWRGVKSHRCFRCHKPKTVRNPFLITSAQSLCGTRKRHLLHSYLLSRLFILWQPQQAHYSVHIVEWEMGACLTNTCMEWPRRLLFTEGLARVLFAMVIKLLIAVLTQLLSRALIITYAVAAASARLLGAGIIINLQ